MVLGVKNYTLLKATSGEEAVDVALRKQPDIIIMDIQLPDVDGFEVIGRLKKNPAFGNIPIIAITAYAMKGDKERIIEAGCDAYLSKPIDTRELPGKVTEMLLRRQKMVPGISENGNE